MLSKILIIIAIIGIICCILFAVYSPFFFTLPVAAACAILALGIFLYGTQKYSR